jgi:hypothetical protein
MWPENDTHDWPSDKVVTQRTMAKCGKKMMPLVRGLCLSVDFNKMWSKLCPSLEDFVTQRTLTKCGPNCAPHWSTLLHSGLQPNVAKIVPLIGGLCHAANFDQKWPKFCPFSEDSVTQPTLTKCGPKCAPRWRTLSHCGLQPNVVQNVPLVGGLCLTVDFDQMWSKHMPLVGGLCHTADFDQMWFKHLPLDGGLRFATEFDHIWTNNVLIIEKRPVPNKQILIVDQCRTQTAISNYVAM